MWNIKKIFRFNVYNKKHPNTLIKMFIKQDEVKSLENTYLEKNKKYHN